MRVLLDTSTLVAAMLPDHVHHSASYPWLAQCKAGVLEFFVSEYATLVEEFSERGILGGAVYDGVIAKAAEQARVDRLVTLNDVHFQRVWPDGAERIVSPVSLASPSSA